MFVIGKGVKGGFYSQHPSLTDLDDGNMKMTTDFRRVYATTIKEWLGCERTDVVLKGRFDSLGVFAYNDFGVYVVFRLPPSRATAKVLRFG